MHSVTGQFSMERNIQNQLKMPSAYPIKGNARAHSIDTVKSVLWHWGYEMLQHLLCSPDLSPCDYNLIPKTEKYLHMKQFSNKNNYFNSNLV